MFYLKFKLQKYKIPVSFECYLFCVGKLKGLPFDCRVRLRNFLRENNLDLETQFIQQNRILTNSDIMQKYVLNLQLLLINDTDE